MSEEQVTNTTEQQEGDAVKKKMKGRKRKEDTKETEQKEEQKPKKEKQQKPVKEKKEKKSQKPKKPELNIATSKGVITKKTKFLIVASADGNKKKRLWVRGYTVGLTEKVSGLKNFKAVSEDDAKKNHLGKTRMLGKVESQEDLNEVVKKFFA